MHPRFLKRRRLRTCSNSYSIYRFLFPKTPVAVLPVSLGQGQDLPLSGVNSEVDDFRRAKKVLIFGPVLNVTGAILALIASNWMMMLTGLKPINR